MGTELSGIVTLLTDFGLRDPFVGVMKGVILAHMPSARLVDLTHGIEPQGLVQGAFWLARAYQSFPPGTVHVAVVDPGVGSERTAMVTHFGGHYFVGPDNGLLSEVTAGEVFATSRAIDAGALGLTHLSRTFHGRDLFAPVAAMIASGAVSFAEVGPVHGSPVGSPVVPPVVHPQAVHGRVLFADHFGNLFLNIGESHCARFHNPGVCVSGQTVGLFDSYSDVPVGQPLCIINSFGVLELAVREGNAAAFFNVASGEAVTLQELPA